LIYENVNVCEVIRMKISVYFHHTHDVHGSYGFSGRGINCMISVCCTVGGKHAQLAVFYHVLWIVRYIYDLCHIVIVWPCVTDREVYSRSVLHRDCFTLSPCLTDRELYSRSVAHRDIGHACEARPKANVQLQKRLKSSYSLVKTK
jgi:hypothetical protein